MNNEFIACFLEFRIPNLRIFVIISFSNAQAEKKLVKQIGENMMNSLREEEKVVELITQNH